MYQITAKWVTEKQQERERKRLYLKLEYTRSLDFRKAETTIEAQQNDRAEEMFISFLTEANEPKPW